MNDIEWERVAVGDADEVLGALIDLLRRGASYYDIDVSGTLGLWQIWVVRDWQAQGDLC